MYLQPQVKSLSDTIYSLFPFFYLHPFPPPSGNHHTTVCVHESVLIAISTSGLSKAFLDGHCRGRTLVGQVQVLSQWSQLMGSQGQAGKKLERQPAWGVMKPQGCRAPELPAVIVTPKLQLMGPWRKADPDGKPSDFSRKARNSYCYRHFPNF